MTIAVGNVERGTVQAPGVKSAFLADFHRCGIVHRGARDPDGWAIRAGV